MRSDSVKNKSVYADQNHAPSLTDVRLECVKFIHMRSPLLFDVNRILILVFIVYRITADLSVEKDTK